MRSAHRQERGALTGRGAHRACPPFKFTTGAAYSECVAHWALHVAHRGKTPRNHPFHPKIFVELIQLKGRRPTSTCASNLVEIRWFYDYNQIQFFFIKQTQEDIKRTMRLGFVLQ